MTTLTPNNPFETDVGHEQRTTQFCRLLSLRGLMGLAAFLVFAIIIPLLVRLGA